MCCHVSDPDFRVPAELGGCVCIDEVMAAAGLLQHAAGDA